MTEFSGIREATLFDASIAISIYYRADDCLSLVLDSILADGYDTRLLELFICDDCSPFPRDVIEKIIESYRLRFGKISYLRFDERNGFRKTYLLRQAIELAESEVFLFLDGDCIYQNGVMSNMIRAAKDSNYLCQGQRVFLYSSCIDWAKINGLCNLREKFYADNTKTRKNIKRYRDSLNAQKKGESGRYRFASGHSMGIKTVLAKEVGITPHSRRGHNEDTDFAQRLYETKGIDVFEVQDAEVLHLFEHH